MHLKRFILPTLILAVGSVLFAGTFSLGGNLGVNYAIINTATRYDETSETNAAFTDLSLTAEYRFNDRFSLASGLHWRANASRYVKTHTHIDEFENRETYGEIITEGIDDYINLRHFLELPLTFRISFDAKPVRIFFGAGGYVGLYLGKWQFGKYYSSTEFTQKNIFAAAGPEARDNLFTAGLIGEVGISTPLGPGDLCVTGRFDYGLTSLSKNLREAVHTYYENITLTAGYAFRVGGAK